MSASGCQHDNMITEDAVMSDTPRTDAEVKRTASIGVMSGMDQAWEDMCYFAKELERALSRYEQAEIPEYPPVIIDSLKAAGKAFNWPLIGQASYDALRAYAAKVTVELSAAKSAQREAETHLSKEIVRIALETDARVATAEKTSREHIAYWQDRQRQWCADSCKGKVAEAERRAEENARDAERYRWLRIKDWFSGKLCVVINPKSNVKLGADCPSRERLDEMIDAARDKDAK